MTEPFSGGCYCKAVRYECRAAPKFTANCHCKDCQRFSACAYVSVFAVPVDAFTLTGEVTWYDVTADSGNNFSRGFCPRCALDGHERRAAEVPARATGCTLTGSEHRSALK